MRVVIVFFVLCLKKPLALGKGGLRDLSVVVNDQQEVTGEGSIVFSKATDVLQAVLENLGFIDENSPELIQVPSMTPSVVPTAFPSQSSVPSAEPSLSPSRSEVASVEKRFGKYNKCEGPCNNDSECKGSLVCQERSLLEPVTGCDGRGETGVNYCVNPNDGPAIPKLPTGSFRLRLWWGREYFWQETFEETFYCLSFRKSLEEGSLPMIKTCETESTRFQVVYQRCNDNDNRQRWQGNWASRRFDIRPTTRTDGCLSQHHHPKPGEVVYLNGCNRAHLTDTGYWHMY